MKNPGIIVKLGDGRLCIIYNNQPLAKVKGKIILHLCDENHNIIKGENDYPKILVKAVDVYNEEMQDATLIGHID